MCVCVLFLHPFAKQCVHYPLVQGNTQEHFSLLVQDIMGVVRICSCVPFLDYSVLITMSIILSYLQGNTVEQSSFAVEEKVSVCAYVCVLFLHL